MSEEYFLETEHIEEMFMVHTKKSVYELVIELKALENKRAESDTRRNEIENILSNCPETLAMVPSKQVARICGSFDWMGSSC